MGDQADMMLDGTLCVTCGANFPPDSPGDGVPRTCSDCPPLVPCDPKPPKPGRKLTPKQRAKRRRKRQRQRARRKLRPEIAVVEAADALITSLDSPSPDDSPSDRMRALRAAVEEYRRCRG